VRCARISHDLRISEAELTAIYLSALQWAANEIRAAGI
jgi:hypothetical protein